MKRKRMGSSGIFVLILSIVAFSLTFTGCSGEQGKTQKASRVVKKVQEQVEEPKTEEPVSQKEPVEDTFAGYTASALKDPFLPFLKEETAAVKRKGALTPLEKFDLGELKIVGVLMKSNETLALIEDNEGKGYTVKKGVKIGKNGGVISQITDKEIVVIEEYFDITGRKVTREKRLTLPLPGGE